MPSPDRPAPPPQFQVMSVGPPSPTDVEHAPRVATVRRTDGPPPVADHELAGRRSGLVLRREVEPLVVPRDHDVERFVAGRQLDRRRRDRPGRPSRSVHEPVSRVPRASSTIWRSKPVAGRRGGVRSPGTPGDRCPRRRARRSRAHRSRRSRGRPTTRRPDRSGRCRRRRSRSPGRRPGSPSSPSACSTPKQPGRFARCSGRRDQPRAAGFNDAPSACAQVDGLGQLAFVCAFHAATMIPHILPAP